jgi:hypothetical protein
VTDRPSHESSGENDQVKPFHARDMGSGQEAADAVAAVLKHAAERDKAAHQRTPAKQQPRWMLPLGINLSLLAVYLLVFPPPWIQFNPIKPPPDAERVESLHTGMFFLTVKIEAYRNANGHLPSTLAEAGIPGDDVDYTIRGDSSYVLIATVGEQTVVFDSSQQSPREFAPDLSQKIGGR